MSVFALVLVVAALALAVYAVASTKGKSLEGWGVALTDLALIVQFCVTHKPGTGVHF